MKLETKTVRIKLSLHSAIKDWTRKTGMKMETWVDWALNNSLNLDKRAAKRNARKILYSP